MSVPEKIVDGTGTTSRENVSILVVGAAVDQETMEILKRVDPMPQVQTYRFHWAIIRSIEAAGGAVDIVSTVPIRDYPFTRKIFWGWKRIQREGVGSGGFTIMPFINLLGLKQITRFISSFFFSFLWLWRHRKEPRKVLLLYGLIVSHLYSAVLLRRLFGCKIIAIVTDPPSKKRSDESVIYLPARAADQRLLERILHSLDGLVALTEPTSRMLAPKVPAIVVEGIISNEVEQFLAEPHTTESDPGGQFVIMYAGQMDEQVYGIEILLDAFKLINDANMALWLFGQGNLSEKVREAACRDSRITYWGFHKSDSVVLSHIMQASVMVVPRPLDQWVSLYSFPSKVLEYLAMGKITVCARLGGIPPEYYPHLVLADEMNATSLAKALREVAGWSLEKKLQVEAAVKSFAWSSKTHEQQGRRMCDFINSIAGNALDLKTQNPVYPAVPFRS